MHDNKLYGLRPLPIQNVVPIFECYNPDTGIAFFSYNNLEQNAFVIPLTQDRNSFTPVSLMLAIKQVNFANFVDSIRHQSKISMSAVDQSIRYQYSLTSARTFKDIIIGP